MKYGNVVKSFGEVAEITSDMLSKINLYSRKGLTAEDVYVFPVVACDNELDRDYDKFTVEALKGLAELYKGKTVICDHNNSHTNQCARIFDTQVTENPSVKTFDGENLHQLICMAYMLKTESNAETIANIDAGIYKEVSVGCCVEKTICSICGEEYYGGNCQHYKNQEYNGKLCFTKLDKAKDAYELSFVAVPAQVGAGVTKWYDGDETVKKGTKNMNYDEIKKGLAEFGIDLDGIAKAKGEVPEMSVILAAVKSKHEAELEELKKGFISSEVIKSAIGKEVSGEEIIEAFKLAEKSAEAVMYEEKAKLYDGIKAKSIEEAIKSGIKAKGEDFDDARYRKLFDAFTVEEINGQAKDWDLEAKATLKTGRKSEDNEGIEKSYAKPNLNF